MSLQDEAKRLRIREANLNDQAFAADFGTPNGSPCLLAQTTTLGTYPTSAPTFFACIPLTILGLEVEGGSAALIPTGGTFFALNLGTAIPPQGSAIVVTFVNNRWVFRYDG